MRLALPPADPESLGKGGAEVGALGIEAAGRFLEVRKAGSVLDVKERAVPEVPCDEVGTAGELVVLVRLIDAEPKAIRPEPASFEFGHGAVNRILRDDRCW